MSEAPPLVPGRIHGVRIWAVKFGRGSIALCGLNGSAWEIGGQPTRAECSGVRPVWVCQEQRGHAPAPRCSCGLYAMHPWPEPTAEVARSLLDGYSLAIPVMGVVEAWGRIEVHEDGFRAEFARPHALILFPESFPPIYAEILTVLARTYRVEVLRLTEADSVVSYCAERAPGMDQAAVERLLRSPPPSQPDPEEMPGDPAKDQTRAKRVLEVVLNAGLMILAIAWYGLWAALGVAILGAIFLGWWDDPPPPPPKPAPQLRVLEQRVVRDGATSRYIAIVHNDSRRLAAVGVYPFGEFRDRHGHRRGAPDKRHKVELRPTIPPGATGVVYDEIDRPLPRRAAAQGPLRRPDGALTPLAVHGRGGADRPAALHHHRPPSLHQGAGPQPGRGGRALRRPARGRRNVHGRPGAAGLLDPGALPARPRRLRRRLPRLTGYPAPDPGQVLLKHSRR